MESREQFSSKLGLVLAAAGSAVGLGNVWRFPTEVGSGGGAAFILVYLLCVALVGVPVMISEFIIGRHTHANAITAFSRLAPGRLWRLEGVASVFVAFIILSYYIVVSGWTLFYLVQSAVGRLAGQEDYVRMHTDFASHPWYPVFCTVAFMCLVHVIVARGIQSGIERFSKVLMPMLLLIISILVICSFSMPGASQGWRFLLHPDFSTLDTHVVLSAVGQAFYSLSLAMGCLCTYASYFTSDTRLVKTAFSVSLLDTLVAVLSVFIIFPAVFSLSAVEADSGPGLVFVTLPGVFDMAFGHLPLLEYLFSTLFYLLLSLAALTSAISLHESVTAYVLEAFRLPRRVATLLVTVSASLLGVGCTLSFGPMKSFTLFGKTLFELFDSVSSLVIMPLGGIVFCLFVGWVMERRVVFAEFTNGGRHAVRLFRIFLFLIRYVVPVAIGLIFINGIV